MKVSIVNKTGMCETCALLHHEPIFFCSSLVERKLTWQHYEELRLKVNMSFCCINADSA